MEERVLQFKNALINSKIAYENYFNAKDLFENISALSSSLEQKLNEYKKARGWKLFLLIIAILSGLISLMCYAKVGDTGFPVEERIQLKIYAPIFLGSSIVFFLLFLIFNNIVEPIKKDNYLRIVERIPDGLISSIDSIKRDISSGNKIISEIKKYISFTLEPMVQETKSILSSTLPSMDQFVTIDYQTYKHVCCFLRIINNNRIETLKELINTMVSDYQKEELVDAIRDANSFIKKSLFELSAQIQKNTEAVKAVSAAVVANTAANVANNSINSSSRTAARSQCLGCAKFSGCHNPYVYGCGAFVPK